MTICLEMMLWLGIKKAYKEKQKQRLKVGSSFQVEYFGREGFCKKQTTKTWGTEIGTVVEYGCVSRS